jgi:hypothetical protein
MTLLIKRQTRFTPTVWEAANGRMLGYRNRFCLQRATVSGKLQEMEPKLHGYFNVVAPQMPHTANDRAAAPTKTPQTAAAPPKALAGPLPNPTARMTRKSIGKTSGKPSLSVKALRIPPETFPSLCTPAARNSSSLWLSQECCSPKHISNLQCQTCNKVGSFHIVFLIQCFSIGFVPYCVCAQ